MNVVYERSSWMETASATNDTATATRAAPDGGISHYITHVSAGFSASVSGVALVLKSGSTTLATWRVYDSFSESFASPIKLTPGEAANLELAAGGGAVVGNVNMAGYTV